MQPFGASASSETFRYPTGSYCVKARNERLSVSCHLERVLVRMQLFPLDPLIDLFLLRLGMHIDAYIPGYTGVEILKAGFVITMFNIFYQHNNTSKEREDFFLNNLSFLFSLSQII